MRVKVLSPISFTGASAGGTADLITPGFNPVTLHTRHKPKVPSVPSGHELEPEKTSGGTFNYPILPDFFVTGYLPRQEIHHLKTTGAD